MNPPRQKKTTSILLILSVIVMTLLTALSFHDGWRYAVGIDKSGYVVEMKTPVEFREAGLTGMNVAAIDADPGHDGYAVVSDRNSAFTTVDHGRTWRPLRIERPEGGVYNLGGLFWVDKKLIVDTIAPYLLVSADGGKSWRPLAAASDKNPREPDDYFNLRRDKNAKVWVSLRRDGKSFDYVIEIDGNGLRLVLRNIQSYQPAVHREKSIMITEGELLVSDTAVSTDGVWVATERGPYFRENGSQTWQARGDNLKSAMIPEVIPSPVNPNSILTHSGGRLWISRDYGKSWQLQPGTGYVVKANYLSDGSIVYARLDQSSVILKDGGGRNIGPGKDFFVGAMQKHLESIRPAGQKRYDYGHRDVSTEDFAIHALGGSRDRVWVVAGDAILYYPKNALDDRYFPMAAKALQDSDVDRKQRLQLFVYGENQGREILEKQGQKKQGQKKQDWQRRPFERLQQLEPAPGGPCAMMLKHGDLYINEVKVPDDLLRGVVMRAGWFRGGTWFYAMSDWRVIMGRVKDCRIRGALRAWRLDTISVRRDSRVFEQTGALKVVSPAGYGVEVIRIRNDSPPPWRWLIYHLSFAPDMVLAWCLLLLWGWWHFRRKPG